MPLVAENSFAVEQEPAQALEQSEAGEQPAEFQQPIPPPQFDPGSRTQGFRVAGYTYKSVYITWEKVSQAQGYRIYRATSKKGRYKLAATVAANGFNDKKNKTLGKYKYYKIRAYGKVNGKTVLGPYSGVFRAKPAIPAATGLRTTGGSGKITVSWNKVAGVKKYRVYRATSPNGKYKRIAITKKCSYTKSATTGKRYYFKVKAYRYSKKSGYSKVVEGLAMPSAPTGVRATCNQNAVNISWKAVTQASFYEVFRSTSKTSGLKKIGQTAGLTFADNSNLTDGVQYFYVVRAVASVNGKNQYGSYSEIGGKDRMMTQALSWYGKKESNKSNKVIITAFNRKMGTNFNYRTPWCAIYVSACGIQSGNSSVIPLSASCPTMVSKFKKWKNFKKGSAYLPSSGDLIFYDWNKNNVADHVGLIVSADSSTKRITAIEGNTRGSERSKFSSDAVAYRYYNAGYSDVLGYGLPKYSKGTTVTYVAPPLEDPVEEEVVEEATEAAMGTLSERPDEKTTGLPADETAINPPEETLAKPADETAINPPDETVGNPADETAMNQPDETAADPPEEPAAEPAEQAGTEKEMLMNVVDFIQDEMPAENSEADQETYDAFLVMNVCEELDINACVLVTTDENGNQIVWNELELDGQTYTIQPSVEGCTPEVLNPEIKN